jgi:hypothetical protein
MEKAIIRILCMGFLFVSTQAFTQTGFSYSGEVRYQNDTPLSGVIVSLYTLDGDFVDTKTSDNLGYYEFEGLMAGTYTITFYTDQPPGGIGLDDAFMIEQYLDGDITLEPIQQLAADVNGNGIINNGDKMAIINYVNHGIPFLGEPWVFLSDPIIIPAANRDGDLRLGSSSGDVNGSLVPDPKSDYFIIDTPVLNMANADSEYLKFNFTSDNSLQFAGMHLEFRIPEGLSIISVDSPIEQLSYCVSDNILKINALDSYSGFVAYEGMLLVTIITKQNDPATDEVYQLDLNKATHFIDMKGNSMSGLKFTLPSLKIEEHKTFAHKAYPNPFISNITIEYTLPEEGRVTITMFDQYGRQIMEVEDGFQSAGIHQERIDGSSLVPGIYQYSISFSGNDHQVDNGIIIKSK